MKTGADGVCSVLEGLGVRTVFGLPGTQNVSLFEGLRQSALRTVLTTDELAATFMAGGYFRASGRVAGVFAIPGPGLAYAVAGLAEARHDSAALLLITGVPASGPGRHFQLQRMDQAGMAAPVVKGCFRVDTSAQIEEIIGVAHGTALSGEPGPVVVEISDAALVARWDGTVAPASSRVLPAPSQADLDQVLDRFRRALRPLLLVGQGAAGAAEAAGLLAEHFGAPVLTTLSGRGIVADDHPLGLGRDLGFGVEEANQLIEEADLVLALGCKFSHNGTGGFRLRINPRQLVHVDASSEVLGANYPASAAIQADVPSFVSALLEAMAQQTPARDVKEWGKSLDRARQSVQERVGKPEPVTVVGNRTSPATFFEALRAAIPRDAIFVTDSGRHQAMARRHFPVYCPRGFLAPSDFQSMGFGLPAAIGAALAAPDRPVVALVGDGGLAMCGLELITAVREGISLTVIVFNDGQLGLIRDQQLREYGRTHAVGLGGLEFSALAAATGADFLLFGMDGAARLRAMVGNGRVTLVEVRLADSLTAQASHVSSYLKAGARGVLGPRVLQWVKRLLRRR